MKLIFQGASRRVLEHKREVYASKADFRTRLKLGKAPSAVQFEDGHTGRGFLNSLQLGGSFDVVIKFTDADIESLLKALVDEDPVASAGLFSRMQLHAVETLASRLSGDKAQGRRSCSENEDDEDEDEA